jgi:hypothetical protein
MARKQVSDSGSEAAFKKEVKALDQDSLEFEIAAVRKVIVEAYEGGVTMPEAEKHAARCLAIQMLISDALKVVDLDARMRKNGVKTIRATTYMDELNKYDKKPAEGFMDNVLAMNALCNKEQDAYDRAEVSKAALERDFGILHEGHIYFRGIAKGRFE